VYTEQSVGDYAVAIENRAITSYKAFSAKSEIEALEKKLVIKTSALPHLFGEPCWNYFALHLKKGLLNDSTPEQAKQIKNKLQRCQDNHVTSQVTS
jgi:hypothetical protein